MAEHPTCQQHWKCQARFNGPSTAAADTPAADTSSSIQQLFLRDTHRDRRAMSYHKNSVRLSEPHRRCRRLFGLRQALQSLDIWRPLHPIHAKSICQDQKSIAQEIRDGGSHLSRTPPPCPKNHRGYRTDVRSQRSWKTTVFRRVWIRTPGWILLGKAIRLTLSNFHFDLSTAEVARSERMVPLLCR